MKPLLQHWRPLLWLAAILVLAGQSVAWAEERINDFHSSIEIQASGALEVTETIQVTAQGRKIRRGIFRDFPTRYNDRLGNRLVVDFELLDVLRDGRAEDYKVENLSNGVRVYIGSPNRFLDPGQYTYTLRYRTTRQLGFFNDYDELYWNVTGNGWDFAITRAHGEVHLPPDNRGQGIETQGIEAQVLQMAAYTGAQGSTAQNAEMMTQGDGTVLFTTTQPLRPREGLTIALAFPKGLVEEPGLIQRLGYLLKDNRALLWGMLAVLLLLAYYLHAWNKVGRDPAPGTIIPEYEPPNKLSPAACYYVSRMSLGYPAMSAAIIDCAVKGHLRIIQDEDDNYQLERLQPDLQRQKPEQALTAGEHRLLSELLQPGQTLDISRKSEDGSKNYQRFMKAYAALGKQLEKEYHKKLFHKNLAYWWKGVLIAVVAVVAQVLLQPSPLHVIGLVFVAVMLLVLFYFLLKAPTEMGRKVMDRIEGFKMYLGTAEQDRLERMKTPELTPEVFETFLPYAFALGVGNTWCERFEQQLLRQHQDPQQHMPAWYYGHSFGHGALAAMGSGLGDSLTSAISSASTPPGGSSGSGGGGSSGGGGGGGGGGGW